MRYRANRRTFPVRSRQHEAAEAADNAASADKMIDVLGIGDEQGSAPEGLSIPAMSTLEPNAETAGPIKSVIHSACEGGAGNFRVQNRHEVLSSDPKCSALVAFLRKEKISAADALEFFDYQWEWAALASKVNKPSAESRDQVVEELLRAEGASVVDFDDDSPDGDPDMEYDQGQPWER